MEPQADGSVEVTSDGDLVQKLFSDGSSWFWQEDGSLRKVDAEGDLVSLTSSSGSPAVPQSDGTYTTRAVDGAWSEFDASGNLVRWASADSRFTFLRREARRLGGLHPGGRFNPRGRCRRERW